MGQREADGMDGGGYDIGGNSIDRVGRDVKDKVVEDFNAKYVHVADSKFVEVPLGKCSSLDQFSQQSAHEFPMSFGQRRWLRTTITT